MHLGSFDRDFRTQQGGALQKFRSLHGLVGCFFWGGRDSEVFFFRCDGYCGLVGITLFYEISKNAEMKDRSVSGGSAQECSLMILL